MNDIYGADCESVLKQAEPCATKRKRRGTLKAEDKIVINSDMKKDQPISRMAVVGSGYWGQNLVRNFQDVRALVAICDTDEGKRRALKEQYPACQILSSYAEVLSDDAIEAVAIATPAETHGDLSLIHI